MNRCGRGLIECGGLMGAGRVCDCDECVHVGKEGPGVRGGDDVVFVTRRINVV